VVIKRLLPLALATFAVGTDGFVIAGLLPAIATDLNVSVPAAGQLVTLFALTFAVAAPVLGAATSGMDRRTALLLALAVFVVGNAATAMGSSYATVMAARVITAAGAGIIMAAATSTAAAITPEERRGRALAFVMSGLAVASALGLPIGTLIGGANWRITLWAVAAVGLLAAVGVALRLPKISLPSATLRERLVPLRRPWVLGVLAVTAMFTTGTYGLYTYIGPALAGATGGSAAALTVVLLAWGVGTAIGNVFVGRLVDRHGPDRVLLASLAASAVVLAVSPLAMSNLIIASGWALGWGVCVGFPVVTQQYRLVSFAPAASPVLLGLNSSAVYSGIALGGAVGGLAQSWLPPDRLGLLSAGVIALALVVASPRSRSTARSR
jgi:predicted MFS family arabinose efflux permease